MRAQFPKSFWWGTAASSPQAEGAAPASDWLAWEAAGKVPPSGNGNGFADRYAEDFALYARYGLVHHRLGIEWARIEPEEGRRDPAAVAHYRAMLEAARSAGLESWVCLHHFALPVWVAPGGVGFCDPRARDVYWRRHVEFIAETYGDLVYGWQPVNEPGAYAINAFLAGTHSPGVQDVARAMEALEGVHLANLIAAQVLRNTRRPISTIHPLIPAYPLDDSRETADAVRLIDGCMWGCWARAINEGVLQVPDRQPIEVPAFPSAFDLVGFSYYSGTTLSADLQRGPYPVDGKVGPMGHVPWSEGMGIVLDRLAAELPGKPILIAEHGVGTHDDELRCAVLRDSLGIVAERLGRGMDIRGFFHWTGIDNYEWAYSWDVPFGLFDRDRRARPSADLLRWVAATGRLDAPVQAVV